MPYQQHTFFLITNFPSSDTSMNFIVGKILELATHKSESPEDTDFVDLGDDSQNRTYKYEDNSDAYTADDSSQGNGYANVSKLNGLIGLVPDQDSSDSKTAKSNSSCSC